MQWICNLKLINKWNFNFIFTHFDPDQIKLCTQVYEALKSININLEDTDYFFTDQQEKVLQEFFKNDKFPLVKDLEYLSQIFDVSFQKVGIWFQKARQDLIENSLEFECAQSTKPYPQLGTLKRHIPTIHEGHKNYQCDSCCKSFSCKGSLTEHNYIIHEGHIDYKCKSCGKSFSAAVKLKRHMQTVHEGKKDHKCESCGKSFSEAAKLKRHIRTVHEGAKNYNCESCGKRFSYSWNLKKHIHTIHEGKSFC